MIFKVKYLSNIFNLLSFFIRGKNQKSKLEIKFISLYKNDCSVAAVGGVK